MSMVLLILAIALAVWAALVDAGNVHVGVYAQLLAIAVVCLAASMLPWDRYFR